MEKEAAGIRFQTDEDEPRMENLMHNVNVQTLMEEHRKQSRKKATGIDGITKDEYEANLMENLEMLIERMKKFQYRPLPVRRTYIPKANGKLRPLGIPAYEDILFVKPYRGSASISISKVCDKETIDLLFAHEEDLMIQEFLDGQEIGADVYIDMISGVVVSIFTKKKIKMRAGETDKAVSFKDPELFDLIESFVLKAGFRGQIDIDIFEIKGEYYISEVNPRFGGGYPHAYESECDHMKYFWRALGEMPIRRE